MFSFLSFSRTAGRMQKF